MLFQEADCDEEADDVTDREGNAKSNGNPIAIESCKEEIGKRNRDDIDNDDDYSRDRDRDRDRPTRL